MPLRRGPFDEGNPAALADQAAKSATQKTTVDIHAVSVRDVQNFIKRSIFQAWQQSGKVTILN